ncbi:MAG: amino acid synthesis family protein [Orrella sp.]
MSQSASIKKIVTWQEEIYIANDVLTGESTRRAWAGAVIQNMATGLDDMSDLTALGQELGEQLSERLLKLIDPSADQPLAYGKSAIVGAAGLLEHGAAVLHPKLGKPLRDRIGQGKSIIPSTVKQAGVGAFIDVPLHGADNEWDFSMLDSVTAMIPGAPLSDEIVVIVALAKGGRPSARIGIKE